MGDVFRDRLLLLLTLVLNWVVGPFLMFFLSVGFFHETAPRFMSGLSLVREGGRKRGSTGWREGGRGANEEWLSERGRQQPSGQGGHRSRILRTPIDHFASSH